MQTNTKKQTMSTKPTTTAPAAPAAPADPQPMSAEEAEEEAFYKALEEADRTHAITLTFTDEEWVLLREDIRGSTSAHRLKRKHTFEEWLEGVKHTILAAAAVECAFDYEKAQKAAAAAKKIGLNFEDPFLHEHLEYGRL